MILSIFSCAFGKMSTQIFRPLFSWAVFSLLGSCKSSLYVLNLILHQKHDMQIFSPSLCSVSSFMLSAISYCCCGSPTSRHCFSSSADKPYWISRYQVRYKWSQKDGKPHNLPTEEQKIRGVFPVNSLKCFHEKLDSRKGLLKSKGHYYEV